MEHDDLAGRRHRISQLKRQGNCVSERAEDLDETQTALTWLVGRHCRFGFGFSFVACLYRW